MIRFLLQLYPREWRRRYGAEMLAHFGPERLGVRGAFDLLNGALDARLHPQWRHRGRRRLRASWILALMGALALAAGAASRVEVLQFGAAAVALAGLLALAVRRRQRRHGWRWDPDDPAAGARMPRKPHDPDPEPLEAVGQVRR